MPMMTTDLDPARIARAATVIDNVFLNSPQFVDPALAHALGRPVLTKVETANPLRSFKGRGGEFLMHRLDPDRTGAANVICATTGNFGQAIAYAGRRRGVRVTVVVPPGVNPTKRDRLELLGAEVVVAAGTGDAVKAEARAVAERHPGSYLVEDGRESAIAEGAGTIGIELLRHPIDTIVVPVGDGALIGGIGSWVKAHAPQVRVVGVCATGAPSMQLSWQAGRPVSTESADTIAEGIAIHDPVPEAVARMSVVDDMVLVDDDDLLAAVELGAHCLGITLEPSGAAGLAALMVHHIPGSLPATVLTGANPRPSA